MQVCKRLLHSRDSCQGINESCEKVLQEILKKVHSGGSRFLEASSSEDDADICEEDSSSASGTDRCFACGQEGRGGICSVCETVSRRDGGGHLEPHWLRPFLLLLWVAGYYPVLLDGFSNCRGTLATVDGQQNLA